MKASRAKGVVAFIAAGLGFAFACSSSSLDTGGNADASTDSSPKDTGPAHDSSSGQDSGPPLPLSFNSTTGTLLIQTPDAGISVPTTGISFNSGVTTNVDNSSDGGPGNPEGYAFINFSSRALACGDLPLTNHGFKSITELSIYVVSQNADAAGDPSIVTKTYAVSGSALAYAGASLITTDSSCAATVAYSATSGTITFLSQDSSGVKGSFNLTFNSTSSTQTLAGTFSFAAPACSPTPIAPDLRTVDAGTPACEN